MKMKSKHSLKIFFLVFSLCFWSLSAEEKDFSLSIEPFFGLRYGCADEFVYQYDNNDLKKLSELNWNYNNAMYLGFDTNISYERFILDIEVGSFLQSQKSCGIMYDRDWEDFITNNLYSESDNYINKGSFIRGFFYGNVSPFSSFNILPAIGMEYEEIKFSGKGLKKQYADSGHSYTEKTIVNEYEGQDVINYQKNTLNLWLGLKLQYNFTKRTNLYIEGLLSPYTYTDSQDIHILRNYNYYDQLSSPFISYRLNIGGQKSITRRFSIKSCVTYHLQKFVKGISCSGYYSTSNNTVDIDTAKSGSRDEYWDFRLGFTYRIF